MISKTSISVFSLQYKLVMLFSRVDRDALDYDESCQSDHPSLITPLLATNCICFIKSRRVPLNLSLAMPPRGGTRIWLDGSPDSRPTKRIRVQSPAARPSQNNAMPAENPPLLTYAQTVELCDKLSPFAQAERYKEWRGESNDHRINAQMTIDTNAGNGSIHDSYCRVCHLAGRLERCQTCNISFHTTCMPRGWIRDSSARWFCPICVQNEWHISPPKDTPPSSPESGTVRDPTGLSLIASIECDTYNPPLSSPRAESPTSHVDEHTPRSSPAQSERGLIPFNQGLPVYKEEPVLRQNHQVMDTFDRPQEPVRGRGRHRKSRSFALDDDVDASLGVIYRKLESIPALKERIKGLESSNSHYRSLSEMRGSNNERASKVIQMQKEVIARLKEKLESQRPSDTTEQPKKSSTKPEETNAELKYLREQRNALQAELRASRDEARNATEMMNK